MRPYNTGAQSREDVLGGRCCLLLAGRASARVDSNSPRDARLLPLCAVKMQSC